MNAKNKIFIIVGSVAIIAAAGAGGYALFAGSEATAPVAPPASSPTATSAASYKDGTYIVSTTYRVPGSSNTLKATVTIGRGKITGVTAVSGTSDRESRDYTDSFGAGVQSVATGQLIGDFRASRIGGASLTSDAFNTVLDAVRKDAKV